MELWALFLKKLATKLNLPFFVGEICVHLFINEDGESRFAPFCGGYKDILKKMKKVETA